VANATWTLSDTRVVLTVGATIVPGEAVLVHVPEALGVRLPLLGLSRSLSQIYYAFN
jgi:hypothetical protein